MPGTPLTRALGPVSDMADEPWEDLPVVADRNVTGLGDRQIETVLAAVAVGVIGAAVVVGLLWLRRRPSRG